MHDSNASVRVGTGMLQYNFPCVGEFVGVLRKCTVETCCEVRCCKYSSGL